MHQAIITVRFNPPDSLLVSFPQGSSDINSIRSISGSRYNESKKHWHLQDTEHNRLKLRQVFSGRLITEPTDKLLMKLKDELVQRNFSKRTIRNYLAAVVSFSKWYGSGLDTADEDSVRRYARWLSEERKFAPRTINLILAALDFFFTISLGKYHVTHSIPRMKMPRQLPPVYSLQEVKRLLDAPKYPKHRLLLMLVYGCGLRVSELVNLRLRDIEWERKVLWVRKGKGAKDRSVMLGTTLRKELQTHTKSLAQENYLFSGLHPDQHLTVRSAEKIYHQACRKAGVAPKGGIHTLRHSFATHLMEKGVELRFIQELLGHASSKTTEIYTHVSTRSIAKIESPLEDLKFAQEEE